MGKQESDCDLRHFARFASTASGLFAEPAHQVVTWPAGDSATRRWLPFPAVNGEALGGPMDIMDVGYVLRFMCPRPRRYSSGFWMGGEAKGAGKRRLEDTRDREPSCHGPLRSSEAPEVQIKVSK